MALASTPSPHLGWEGAVRTGGGDPGACPLPTPSTRPLRPPDKRLLSATCSQVLCSHGLLSWEPRSHGPHPSGASKRGRQARCASVPLGFSHSCLLSSVIRGTGHCHHPPPVSAIEGSRAGPRASLRQLRGGGGLKHTGAPGGPCSPTAARPTPPRGAGSCGRPRAGGAGPLGAAASLQRGCG